MCCHLWIWLQWPLKDIAVMCTLYPATGSDILYFYTDTVRKLQTTNRNSQLQQHWLSSLRLLTTFWKLQHYITGISNVWALVMLLCTHPTENISNRIVPWHLEEQIATRQFNRLIQWRSDKTTASLHHAKVITEPAYYISANIILFKCVAEIISYYS